MRRVAALDASVDDAKLLDLTAALIVSLTVGSCMVV
jgi:hypothetical protein